jgi:hypothetical protein
VGKETAPDTFEMNLQEMHHWMHPNVKIKGSKYTWVRIGYDFTRRLCRARLIRHDDGKETDINSVNGEPGTWVT